MFSLHSSRYTNFNHRFGIIASTPRDGTTRRPFQQDTSIIRDREITSGKAGFVIYHLQFVTRALHFMPSVCGRTLAGGNNDVQSQLTGEFLPFPRMTFNDLISLAAVNAGLPSASSTGALTMTLHQINGGELFSNLANLTVF